MTTDIFKLFKKSIETVTVTDDIDDDDKHTDLKAIVKRRKLTAETVAESQDVNNNITVHFKPKDASHIELGTYVKIDDVWHSILEIDDGTNFDNGKSEFLLVTLNNDALNTNESDPSWQ